jgi:hypothetical protein
MGGVARGRSRTVLLALEPPLLGDVLSLLVAQPDLALVVRAPGASAEIDLTGHRSYFDVVVAATEGVDDVDAGALILVPGGVAMPATVGVVDGRGRRTERLRTPGDLLRVLGGVTPSPR